MKAFAILALAFSIGVSAVPSAAPFKIQIAVESKPTLYLKSDGTVTENMAQAASCSLVATKLSCGGKPIGAGHISDMALMTAYEGHSIDSGFSLDSGNKLHWVNKGFMKKVKEADWALMKNTKLYAQLGCAHTFHTDYWVPAKVTAVFK